MGEVRLVRDTVVGRDVAIKRVRGPMAHDGISRERFLREARIQGQLEQPAIVPVYDLAMTPDGRIYFTMRRVRGRALLSVMSRVCLAIDFAHARGVVHGDIKPANLMLGDWGEVYVLDWGRGAGPAHVGLSVTSLKRRDRVHRVASEQRASRACTNEYGLSRESGAFSRDPRGTRAAVGGRMRWLVTLFMLVVCGLNAGCSLIGLGIGSTVPEYATYRSPSEALEKQVSVIGEDGNEHSGTLVAAAGNELLLADESHKATWVVASKLEPLRHKIGDYAATGLAIGLAIDVALIAIGAFAFSQVKCITVCGL